MWWRRKREPSPILHDFPICGTAQLAMQGVAAEDSFRRALRAWARGEIENAKPLVANAIASWSHSLTILHEHVRYADFLLEGASSSDGIRVRTELENATKRLDDLIAHDRRDTDDLVMWLCRALVQRGHSALLFGELPRAETFYVRAIELLSAIWGEDHLEVGSYAEDYATLLFKMGRSADAEAQIRRARVAWEKAGSRYVGRD